MGREIKRVALNFEWPLNEVWKGYINPFKSGKCKWCNGSMYTPFGESLRDEWYYGEWQHNLSQEDVDALSSADSLWDFTRVPINEEQTKIVKEKIKNGGNSWLPFHNGYHPTAEEVNKWSHIGFGHDSCNFWICMTAKAKKLGQKIYCSKCHGNGYLFKNRRVKKQYKNWKEYEPPSGPGYQLWETTSEGSPMSPVFEKPEELAFWLEKNKASSFGKETCTYEQWLNFIVGPGWAPSAVMTTGKGLTSGVAAVI